MLHVVVVNDYAYVNGGAGKIALVSAVALARRGHTVTLFTAVGPVAPDLADVPGLRTICLGQQEIADNPNRSQAVVQGIWNSSAGSRMKQLLKSEDRSTTVIHFHSWTKALSSSTVRAAVTLGFSVVITLHEYFLACPAGTFYNHPQQKICHLRPMSIACITSNCDSRNYGHKLWRVGRQWVQRHPGMLPEGVHDYISISDLSEEILRPFLPPQAVVHRVRNFIDIEPMPAIDVRANRLFTFSGRLSAEKGPMLLAECSKATDIDALFIGDGPLRQQIERLAPKASITGWLSPADAVAQMGRSRALVFPSLWYETQGLVVAEAAAIGVPAIVPSDCAAREWVADGKTGLWFRGGDTNDFIDKVIYLRDNPDVALAMGQEAHRRYSKSPITKNTYTQTVESVYSSILQKRATWSRA